MSDSKLYSIIGGKAKYSILAIVGGLITFLIGVVDGQIKLK